MLRTVFTYKPQNIAAFKKQLLAWSMQFNEAVWLDSNKHVNKYSSYNAVLAVSANTYLKTTYKDAFNSLDAFCKQTSDWVFGYLSYDLKNDVENLQSNNTDGLQFPDLYFFQPKKIFFIKKNTVKIKYLTTYADDFQSDLKEILNQNTITKTVNLNVKMKLRMSKSQYISKVKKILWHIKRGDIYEANFCQEFYSENIQINPYAVYNHLNKISKAPFASFLKINDKYLLSASPERFLKKKKRKIISQPIKGTAKRGRNLQEDTFFKQQLKNDAKERSENIMIVDLVRNDLSRNAKKRSVKVQELCKVYTFKQVHQMISTISAKVSKKISPITIIKSAFPMGSMTGAPKISAMQIIENLETTKRGLYSGAVGYLSPKGNFDFNVVIRSILYHATKKYVSYQVGGAITAKSDPLREYEECLIKAKAMREVLENQ